MSSSFTIGFPVRFRDIDVLGHVNNAVYFTYMESARTEYWMHLFGVPDLAGLSFIVAHAECDFKVPVKAGDQIAVSIRTSAVRNSSFDWDYEIRDSRNGTIFANGKTIQVYYDYRLQKGIPIPPDVRAKLLEE